MQDLADSLVGALDGRPKVLCASFSYQELQGNSLTTQADNLEKAKDNWFERNLFLIEEIEQEHTLIKLERNNYVMYASRNTLR